MTNKQWLLTLPSEKLAELLHTGNCNEYCSNDCELEDDCVDGITDWLDSKHIEQLAKCPFKCEGCSREVKTVLLPTDLKFYDIVAKETKKFCYIGKHVFSSQEEAVSNWNNAVNGKDGE